MDKNMYVKIIIQMLNSFDEADQQFLKQLYTLIKKHIERKGRH